MEYMKKVANFFLSNYNTTLLKDIFITLHLEWILSLFPYCPGHLKMKSGLIKMTEN